MICKSSKTSLSKTNLHLNLDQNFENARNLLAGYPRGLLKPQKFLYFHTLLPYFSQRLKILFGFWIMHSRPLGQSQK